MELDSKTDGAAGGASELVLEELRVGKMSRKRAKGASLAAGSPKVQEHCAQPVEEP